MQKPSFFIVNDFFITCSYYKNLFKNKLYNYMQIKQTFCNTATWQRKYNKSNTKVSSKLQYFSEIASRAKLSMNCISHHLKP